MFMEVFRLGGFAWALLRESAQSMGAGAGRVILLPIKTWGFGTEYIVAD
jgi:hypothetical protein